MDELIKLVSKKAGISEAKAKQSVETVIGFLKKQLPAPLAGQIDGLLSGSGSSNALDEITNGLGGILGGRRT